MSSTPRFFVPPSTITGETAILPPEAAHHIRTVLKMRVGEPVILHDGANNAYDTSIVESAKNVVVQINTRRTLNTEPKTRITIAQALPKTSDKIEQVLQHGTEIGAAGFAFFAAMRSVARLADGEKIEKRLIRWQGIIQSAAEQSGRGVLPSVIWLPFPADVAQTFGEYESVLIAHEAARLPLSIAVDEAEANTVLVLVGPEGGFTDEEIALFDEADGVTVSLGARVLRTETAALVMLSQILFARESAG